MFSSIVRTCDPKETAPVESPAIPLEAPESMLALACVGDYDDVHGLCIWTGEGCPAWRETNAATDGGCGRRSKPIYGSLAQIDIYKFGPQ